MMKYAEPSKEMFEFFMNDDGTYTVTDILIRNIDHLEIPEGVSILGPHEIIDLDEEREKGELDPQTVSFPSTLKSIEVGFFNGNSRMETLRIPGNVTHIGSGAFQASKFKRVELEEGLEDIGMAAFSFCSELKTIVIPASCKRIGWRCFADCESLEEIHIKEPSGWEKWKLQDGPAETYKKVMFGKVPPSKLLDTHTAAVFLSEDVDIRRK